MKIFQEAPLAPLSFKPIRGWQNFLQDGRRYLATASAGYGRRKEIFTPKILYNIIAMSVEKFVMAALMRHGKMPYNHTMTDLVEALEEAFPHAMPADIREGLLNLDTYQDICDPYEFTIMEPGPEDIPFMLELASHLQYLVEYEPSTQN
ncbi:MAG: hypothetical protein SCH71_00715 [Desulfobulbaceae bacterium]|nr:hypothetical protein [Desulfobulbaceae bacterium]